MFALAHLSDPHLADWSADRPWSLANKRLTGWLSWRLNRRRIHLARVLDLMLSDIASQTIDHVAVTGDLINISLPREFENAAHWLRRLGPSDKVTVIPGNHDAYVAVPQSEGIGRWRDYMTDLAWERTDTAAAVDSFPFVRRVGPLALIGVSTAVPMPPFVAAGKLGAAQLTALRGILTQLRNSAFRVVLIHHPPFPGGAYRRKALLDAKEFVDVLRESGAELVLHGHTDVAGLGRIGQTPVIGVPSASAVRSGHKDAAAYNLYRISQVDRDWKVGVEIRGLSSDQSRFAPIGGFELTIPALQH
ncbi:MAG: metallophosphoesterase family protein [Dongiaceae bacterium]